MNLWASLVPEQRIAYQPPVAKPQPDKRKQLLNDAALRSSASRTKREHRQAEIARLTELVKQQCATTTQGQELETKRKEFGIRQYEFARILGISRQHYSDIKHGRSTLHLAAIRRAFALGVDAGVLLGNLNSATRPD